MQLIDTNRSRVSMAASLLVFRVRVLILYAGLLALFAPVAMSQDANFTDLLQLGPGIDLPSDEPNPTSSKNKQLIELMAGEDSESTPSIAQLIQGVRPTEEQMRLLDEGLIRPEVFA